MNKEESSMITTTDDLDEIQSAMQIVIDSLFGKLQSINCVGTGIE